MMKRTRILSLLLLVAVLCACCAAPAFAEGENFSYTPKRGDSASFTKYLVMKEDANVPGVTFDYEIAAGTPVDAGDNTLAVLAGPVVVRSGAVTEPNVSSAAFTSSDSKLASVAQGDSVTLQSGEVYVKKTVTIDFTGVLFPAPGVYRYILTEKETEGALGISYDTQRPDDATERQRIVDVYVTANAQDNLVVSAYLIHYLADAPQALTEDAALADKSDGFVNTYATQNLSFAKTVAGNQASKDKYFKFTVTISGVAAGTVYDVDLSGAEAAAGSSSATNPDYRGKANPTKLTVPAGADSVTADFYLRHDQAVTIKGLAQGSGYSVTEAAEDYTAADGSDKIAVPASGTEGDEGYTPAKTYSDAASGTIADADIYTGFTNSREGSVPTGVALTVLPGVLIVGIAVFGLVMMAKKRRG